MRSAREHAMRSANGLAQELARLCSEEGFDFPCAILMPRALQPQPMLFWCNKLDLGLLGAVCRVR